MLPPLVLVTDDDPAIRGLLVSALRRRGLRAAEASNGLEAYHAALIELPACVVIDWMMPVMNGLEAIERLRGDERTRDVPIVMVTAQSSLREKVAVLEAGAQDYLVKPVQPAELAARVAAQIRWAAQLGEGAA